MKNFNRLVEEAYVGMYLTEKSTLSSLGLNGAQIGTIHQDDSDDIRLTADADWQPITNKKEVNKAFDSNNINSLVAVNKDGSCSIIIKRGDKLNKFKEIAANGDVTLNTKYSTIKKAVAALHPGKYFGASGGASTIYDDSAEHLKWDKIILSEDLLKLLLKKTQQLVVEMRATLKEKILVALETDDTETLKTLSSNLHYNKKLVNGDDNIIAKFFFNSWGENTMREWLAEILKGGNIKTWGYYGRVENLLVNASKTEVRQATAEMLRVIKRKLAEEFEID